MRDKLYVVIFAVVISAAASLVLTFANSVLKERIERNRQLEIYASVLDVLGIEIDETAGFKEMEGKFNRHAKLVSEETVKEGKIQGMDIYRGVDEKGETIGYALKISGAGFWGPIKGFLAVEPDMRTIKGLTFFEQEETPGLGGRIMEEEFQRQFVGKQIYATDSAKTEFRLTPPKGRMFDTELVGKKDINEVDAITGATETSGALERLLNRGLVAFQMIVEENDLE